MSFDELLGLVRQHRPGLEQEDVDILRAAYDLAEERHAGQERRSKCPFFVHPYEVAYHLAGMPMDVATVCAGLLHDVLEDTDTTAEELREVFGESITRIVEGVTKLTWMGRERIQRFEERQAENYRQMVLGMTRDVRVIIVKLADRLHNMETIQFMQPVQRRRIAMETKDIYAPLAARLGIHQMRNELEDLAFKALDPEGYRDIARMVQVKREERETYTEEFVGLLRAQLEKSGLKSVEVRGRSKHLYSIYRKINVRGVPFEHIDDLVAFRVLVDDDPDCYAAVGTIHAAWTPVPGRFNDYIANAKSNGYQSLHTSVFDRGRPIEIQIRTFEMDEMCEKGVAAHWTYKSPEVGGSSARRRGWIDRFAVLRDVLSEIQDVRNDSEFLQSMRGELFDDEIHVFTPKGDVKRLRTGATPLDFAFAVHTEVGCSTVGARANGRIVHLKSELKTGDVVEILTDTDGKPSRDWLRHVKTPRARNKIKHWFREQEFEQNVTVGRQLIATELRQHGLTPKGLLTPERLVALAEEYDAESADALLADVGAGQISPQRVYHSLAPLEHQAEEPEPEKPRPAQMIDARLDGIEHTVMRVAKCCAPLPGDNVVGYVTRGRGVTVHMRDCPRIAGEFERIVTIEWSASGRETFPTEIVIESNDRTGLVRDISDAIAAMGLSIVSGEVRTPDTFTAVHHWTIKVTDALQLESLRTTLARVRGVRRVSRRRCG